MKVLHLNSYDYRGGSETVFNYTRSNKANSKNYSGFISTSGSEKSDLNFVSWENNGKLLGILNYIFSYQNYKELLNFESRNDFNIIHIHDFFSTLSPSILAAIKKIKQSKKIKIIQTVHDYHMICPNASLFNYNKNVICQKCVGKKIKSRIFFENCDRRGKLHTIIKGLRSIVANNVLGFHEQIDLFIAPSEFIQNKLIEDGIKTTKIKVIRNPIAQKRTETIKERKNIIYYFGRLSRDKNVGFIIDAFIQWKEETRNDFQLNIIGQGEEENLLREKSESSSWSSSITFNPFLKHNELIEVIKHGKYFTMASLWFENAPMVILEAFSAGLIPVVPDFGGMKESIEQVIKAGRIYHAHERDSWINVFNDLEKNYATEYRKLEASQHIINDLGVEIYLDKLSTVYSDLTKNK